MTHSDEHAEIRGQLALYVAGGLEAGAEANIARHIATCPGCAAELERWQLIGSGLRRLPTPQPSSVLFERTRAMAFAHMEARAEQRRNTFVLVSLIFFSWTVAIAGWPVFRFATGGLFSLLDIQFRQTWILFGIFTAVAWLAGGCAAVMLSARRQQERRFA
jgi:anti-sigma factor RsiW